jgi:hypothetical protein
MLDPKAHVAITLFDDPALAVELRARQHAELVHDLAVVRFLDGDLRLKANNI